MTDAILATAVSNPLIFDGCPRIGPKIGVQVPGITQKCSPTGCNG